MKHDKSRPSPQLHASVGKTERRFDGCLKLFLFCFHSCPDVRRLEHFDQSEATNDAVTCDIEYVIHDCSPVGNIQGTQGSLESGLAIFEMKAQVEMAWRFRADTEEKGLAICFGVHVADIVGW